jgi:DNA-binding response OmpR family regulator
MAGEVLIVEDEAIIAMDLAQTFEDWGWTVLGPAGRLEQAETLRAAARPDLAVLDVNLGGDTSHDLARALLEGGTRVIFLSGDSASHLPGDLDGCPSLSKPVDPAALRRLAEGG